MDNDDLLLEGFNTNSYTSLFLQSNTGKRTEVTSALMAVTAETEAIIVVTEIVLAAIEIGVVDLAESVDTTIVDPVIATAEIASEVIVMVEIASEVIVMVASATVVIGIGVADMAETVTMIVGTENVIATMIVEVGTVLVTEIGDVTLMTVIVIVTVTVTVTVTVSEVHGVTVEMLEAILIETRGSQVRD